MDKRVKQAIHTSRREREQAVWKSIEDVGRLARQADAARQGQNPMQEDSRPIQKSGLRARQAES